jgi:MFS family permease
MVATARGARLHPAWVAAGVAFVALLCAAGFRAAPGVLMVPLEEEFGWSRGVVSLAVGVNLVLFGVTAPFAAALMERFGVRAVTSVALLLIAAGSGLSVGVTSSWQLVLLWGVLIGLGTGSMALVFAAIVANRWFVRRRGLVMGVLTAASATGQLVFLPVVALMSERSGWRSASLVVAAAALAVIPLVLLRLPNGPAELGVAPYGGPAGTPVAPGDPMTAPGAGPGPARRAVATLAVAARTRTFWALAVGFAICGASTNGFACATLRHVNAMAKRSVIGSSVTAAHHRATWWPEAVSADRAGVRPIGWRCTSATTATTASKSSTSASRIEQSTERHRGELMRKPFGEPMW